MRQCPQCQRQVAVETVVCPYCGTVLTDQQLATTRTLEEEDDGGRSSRWGKSRIDGQARLLLRLMHSGVEFVIDPMQHETISLGRTDPATSELPTIDLGKHEGEPFGVSRKHVLIRRTPNSGLTVQDLGSANGTFLNGERLTPLQPRILRDGDELRVARMVITIAFVTDSP
jgi:transcription initiation factor TFIIIB Brf1 subunit/transcription initiation factor TFIIB